MLLGHKALVEREHQDAVRQELISSLKNWIFLHFLNSLNATAEARCVYSPTVTRRTI